MPAGPPHRLTQAGSQIFDGIDGRADGALLGEPGNGGGDGRHVLPDSASLKATHGGGDHLRLRCSQAAYTTAKQLSSIQIRSKGVGGK